MPYTKKTLDEHLAQLSMRSGTAWAWQANAETAPFWTQLKEYCWTVYSKAFNATGEQAIGRMPDLTNFKMKVCNIDLSKGHTLLIAATKGNALQMDKWSPVLNDAWVLGGVHRLADFVLHSPRSFENLWENSNSRVGMVVTARELMGLVAFGYVRTIVRGGEKTIGKTTVPTANVTYVCKEKAKALSADLLTYASMISEADRRGRKEILQHMGLRDDVAQEIRTFDRSKLRPVQR
jgi:hypothetical protein